jgi:hypothetical protein
MRASNTVVAERPHELPDPMKPAGVTRSMNWRELAVVTALFTVLTLVLTYPQVLSLSTHTGTHYDALFSIWRLAWVAHQLITDPVHLFDANIFYPQPKTLTYSDAMLLLGVSGAPAIWAGWPVVVVYNLLVLASFVTAAVAMYVLMRAFTESRIAATFAGVVFAFQSYRFAHYPQIELLWTCWIPLALLALHRCIENPTWRNGALLGLMVSLQALSCLYYAVFLITFLPVIALCLTIARRNARLSTLAKPALASIVCAAAMLGPYSLPYLRSSVRVGTRSLEDVSNWSPKLVNYISAQHGHWLYPTPPGSIDAFEGVLFPGVLSIALACCGVFFLKPRRLVLAYAVVLVLAFDLSLGVNGLLYGWLYDAIPLYRGLRVPARLFVIVAAALAVLGGIGVARIQERTRHGRLIALALVLFAIVESVSAPIPLEAVPTRQRLSRWLAKQPRGAVFEWPTPTPQSLGFTQEPRYMYQSTNHWQPLVNGYSGHSPLSYIRLLDRTRTFPNEEAVRYLQDFGVRYVILHNFPDAARYTQVRNQIAARKSLRFQFKELILSHDSLIEEVAVYLLDPVNSAVSPPKD